MRGLFLLLLFSGVIFAGLDQNYSQDVRIGGASIIEKTSDISVFTSGIDDAELLAVEEECTARSDCRYSNKTITIVEEFEPGNYYTYEEVYSFPFVEQRIEIRKIPTDRFSKSLDGLLFDAGAIDDGSGSAQPINLYDNNSDDAAFLRRFSVAIGYEVTMPTGVYEAYSGNVSGKISGRRAYFDLVDVMGQESPIIIRSREVNMSLIIIVSAVIVFAALFISLKNSFKKTRNKK